LLADCGKILKGRRMGFDINLRHVENRLKIAGYERQVDMLCWIVDNIPGYDNHIDALQLMNKALRMKVARLVKQDGIIVYCPYRLP